MKNIINPIFTFLIIMSASGCIKQSEDITPNKFKGTDTQRIQTAIEAAEGTTNKIVIPSKNNNGTNIWLLDSAILLPSNMTVILDNCVIQLSDDSRDNMFRSNNVGMGITNIEPNKNINIIGVGDVYLKGAKNPRATGDSGRRLVLDPVEESKSEPRGKWGLSYGSDAGKEGIKQTGDWRNIMILMSYVDRFKLKNVNIENAHAWAISCERTVNAEISDVRINSPEDQIVNGKKVLVGNRDGIDLRHGCKNFRIDNISGNTGDDFVALSTLGIYSKTPEGGSLNSTMVSTRRWRGPEDDTEQIYVTNLVCKCLAGRAVAIRTNDVASINNVYINGIIYRGPYCAALLVGGKGYGHDSQPGKINNIHAMNITGKGQSLIQIEEAISDCSFMNGIFQGEGDVILYKKVNKSETSNIIFSNLKKMEK